MNRREALAVLVAMPAVTRIATVPAQADDVIVVEAPGPISSREVETIRTALGQVWPGRRIVVLGDGMTLKLVATAAAGEGQEQP